MKTILLLILGLYWKWEVESSVLQAAKIQQLEPVDQHYTSDEIPYPDIPDPYSGPEQVPDIPHQFRYEDKLAPQRIESIFPEIADKGHLNRVDQNRDFGERNFQNVRPKPEMKAQSFRNYDNSGSEKDDECDDDDDGDDDDDDDDDNGGDSSDVSDDGDFQAASRIGKGPEHIWINDLGRQGGKNVQPNDIMVVRNPRRRANVGKRKKRQIEPSDSIGQKTDSMGKTFETVCEAECRDGEAGKGCECDHPSKYWLEEYVALDSFSLQGISNVE